MRSPHQRALTGHVVVPTGGPRGPLAIKVTCCGRSGPAALLVLTIAGGGQPQVFHAVLDQLGELLPLGAPV